MLIFQSQDTKHALGSSEPHSPDDQSTVDSVGKFYSPLIFQINLHTLNSTDHDADGILTIDEDLNGDNIFSNDDTDGDSIPNYRDRDDDGDGILTKDEYDQDGDGEADDTDGDGVPDYLDNDNED